MDAAPHWLTSHVDLVQGALDHGRTRDSDWDTDAEVVNLGDSSMTACIIAQIFFLEHFAHYTVRSVVTIPLVSCILQGTVADAVSASQLRDWAKSLNKHTGIATEVQISVNRNNLAAARQRNGFG